MSPAFRFAETPFGLSLCYEIQRELLGSLTGDRSRPRSRNELGG